MNPLLSLKAINKTKFTLMGTEREKINKTNILLTQRGLTFFIFFYLRAPRRHKAYLSREGCLNLSLEKVTASVVITRVERA